jgi:rod shape-determining protein MreD
MSYSTGRILLSSQREGQIARYRSLALLGVPLAAVLLQIYLPLLLPFLSFLELPLLVVLYFSLMRRSQVGGIVMGAFVGLAQDSLSTNPLGMFGIVKTLVGYFGSSVGVRLDVENVFIRLVMTFFFYCFHQLLYWVMSRALLAQAVVLDVQKMIVTGVLNTLVGLALYHVLDRLRERT